MAKKVILFLIAMTMIVSCSSIFAYDALKPDVKPTSLSQIGGTVTSVLGVMQWGGYVIAIGMLIWVGVKYVTAGAGEKAKAKETLVPIVIGAVLIAGAVTIATAIFGAASGN